MWPRRLAEYLRWRAVTASEADRLPSLRLSAALALIPAVLAGAVAFGWRAPCVIGVSCAASGLAEVVARAWRPDRPGPWGWSWLATGLLVGVLLPPHAPLWLPALCAVVSVGAGQFLFGCRGFYWLPPSALGLLAAHLFLPVLMASGDWPVLRSYDTSGGWLAPLRQDVAQAVPRGQYRELMVHGTIPLAPAVSQPTPQALLRAPAGESPRGGSGLAEHDPLLLLCGYSSGTAGGTSGLAWLMAASLLLLTGAARWRPALAGLIVFAAGIWAIPLLATGAPAPADRVLAHVLTGGFPAALMCWAADPAVVGKEFRGRFVAGAVFGALALLQRTLLPPVEDLAFAAVLSVSLTPVWDLIWRPMQPESAAETPEGERDAAAEGRGADAR